MKKISYLAEGYFHQDFDAEFGSPDAVLRGFCEKEPASEIARLLAAINEALGSTMNESELQQLWDPRDISSYEPSDEGRTYREWFAHIRDVLTADRSLG